MDDLAVTDTGMMGHYLTLDLPCNNKQQAVHPLPNPDAKWGNHQINAHRTPVSPRPAASSTTGTSFFRDHEGPSVYWYIM